MPELNWWTLMSKHWGKLLFGLMGLIFAILVITLNLGWAIFIYICVGLGIFVGWRFDQGGGVRSFIEKMFPSGDDNY